MIKMLIYFTNKFGDGVSDIGLLITEEALEGYLKQLLSGGIIIMF